MRIVYDDQKVSEFMAVLDEFLFQMRFSKVCRNSYGMKRVQSDLVKEQLQTYVYPMGYEIGCKATHAHGIGNNCLYPVFYTKSADEKQQVCFIAINSRMYSECYVYVEDYTGTVISPCYDIHTGRIGKRVKA